MDYSEIEERVKLGEIKTKMILEMVGFPQEHVDKSLGLLVRRLEELQKKGILIVIDYKINPAIKMDDKFSQKMCTGFVEMEMLFHKLSDLIGVIYDYMPSSVEILGPDRVSEDAVNITDILNDLIAKLHLYDVTVKKMKAINIMLSKELKELKGEPVKED